MNKHLIIGVDEVGRGCVAGPVVACAFCHYDDPDDDSLEYIKENLRDSKRLSAQQRNDLYISLYAHVHGVGIVEVADINQMGINNASLLAMKQAISNIRAHYQSFDIKGSPRIVIIDGNQLLPNFTLYLQQAIVKADTTVHAVMAASIIAKVARDNLMKSLHKHYPEYNWNKNKGYCTKDHSEAIKKYGVTPLHRNWPKYYKRIGVKYDFSR